MTVFLRHRKTTKIMFLPLVFLLKLSLQTQKSTFTAKFSLSPSLEVIFFALIRCWGPATASRSSAYWPCFDFQHHDCTACWEIATVFGRVRSFPHIFHIYTKSTAILTTEFSRLLCSSVVANFKICRGRSRNSFVVESQGYFVLEQPFLQFHEQWPKFANEVNHLTCFFEKVDSEPPSRLMMLIKVPFRLSPVSSSHHALLSYYVWILFWMLQLGIEIRNMVSWV